MPAPPPRFTAAVLPLLALAAFAAPAHAQGCTPRRAFSVRAPVVLLATPTADTVRAGPGPVRYEGDTTRLAAVHGQRVRIEGVGGEVPAELPAAGTDAVLVPYACRFGSPRKSGRGAWAAPGTPVFVGARLRPREQWAGGLPTFDVDLVSDLYPSGYLQRDLPDSPRLSPEEMFELSRTLPAPAQAGAAPEAAFAPLLAWARANSTLAGHFPAAQALAEVREALQPCRDAFERHPVAGTYRATVRVDGAAPLTFYFRTGGRGEPACAPAPHDPNPGPLRPRAADTTHLYMAGAPRQADLPAAYQPSRDCRGRAFPVVNAGGGAGGRWAADFNYLLLPDCFPDQPRVDQAAETLLDAFIAGRRTVQQGEFRALAGGGMRFHQAWSVDGRVVLEVTATRTDPRTLHPEQPE